MRIFDKSTILITLAIIIFFGSFFYFRETKKIDKSTNNKTEEFPDKIPTIDLCYYNFSKTNNNLYDKSWLKISITGENVSGEFQNLPAEKDSKVGKFEGTVGVLNQNTMSRRANTWWNSLAEGMNNKEELIIDFGDGSAAVGFGEMINRGDGVYVYKNKNNLYYQSPMSQIDCEYLDEKLFIEKYIRENINNVATDKAVLGGKWYITSILVNPSSHTADISYEDGHIASKANILYNYQKSTNNVEIIKFEVIK